MWEVAAHRRDPGCCYRRRRRLQKHVRAVGEVQDVAGEAERSPRRVVAEAGSHSPVGMGAGWVDGRHSNM